jgi:hypothetical protein
MFQASTLASLGVVLALAVIMLLFLYALQREQSGAPPPGLDPGATPGAETAVAVVIGERTFRRIEGGWAEVELSAEAISSARVERRPTLEEASDDLRPVLERLGGDVVLRRSDSIVRFVEY